jgi:pimeloyl-ACP methyl ester carboxylesterase
MTATRSDEAISPFRIAIEQHALDDLHERLDRTRWPDELPGVGWGYGIPLDYVKELAHYWRHEFDWRAAEDRLNACAQFTTTIDGATLHLAHIRSPEPDATPLIMIHGWPGSFAEFTETAGPLVDPVAHGGDRQDAFHLVLPSIPGFGFSGPTFEPGWHERRVATAFIELMRRLGYERYVTQGGDWGAAISREMGRTEPQRVIGVHLNLLVNGHAVEKPDPTELGLLSPAERARTIASWAAFQEWLGERAGYAALQSTRPQTLAYGLTDSPVGQLAWIMEKFKDWTDSHDRAENAIDRDHLLTNVSIYWFTATAGSSARIYHERAHADHRGSPPEPSATPTAVAVFPRDNFIPLRHVGERTNNIVRWTEFDRGGHFAAMEQPDLLIADLRAFVRQLRADR